MQAGNTKTTAIIAAIALVAIIALALFAYNALTQSSSGSSPSRTARTSSGVPSATSQASSDGASSAGSTAAHLDPASVYASLESEFVSFDGATVTWADLADGKPIVVNFWATWCPYCVDEMDDYQQLYEEYGDDVVFVMVDVCDGQRETRAKAEKYLADHGYTFPVYFDDSYAVVNEFGVSGFPTTVVFTPEGNVEYAAAGRINATNMRSMLEYLL